MPKKMLRVGDRRCPKSATAFCMNKMVYGISYSGWTMIHKVSIILISFLVVFHIGQHWKWYRTVVSKGLLAKNKLVSILSVIFLIVALTGYLSWFIDLAGNAPIVRKTFLEIHDKVAIVFFIYLFLHVQGHTLRLARVNLISYGIVF